MFSRWGLIVSKLRWPILALSVVFLAFSGIWGTGVFRNLAGDSSLNDPASQSQRIGDQIKHEFGSQNVDLIGLYSSPTRTVHDPQFRASVESVANRVGQDPAVATIHTYWSTGGSPQFVSRDGRETFLTVQLKGDPTPRQERYVRNQLDAPGLTTHTGGLAAVDLDINQQVGRDVSRAETIAAPLLLLALLFVFGNVVAAAMPVLIGLFAVLGAFLLTRVLTLFMTVSSFSINVITIFGLGLAVDYGLFIVSRYREELEAGRDTRSAISRTLATAGRTVAISGLLLTLAMASLLLFPQVLLRSLGAGGAAAVLFAMLSALTVLPAVLAILGPRIDAGRIPGYRGRQVRREARHHANSYGRRARNVGDGGRWGRIAASVMRRPVAYLVGCVIVLGTLAAPFLGVRFGGIDERMLPSGTDSRVVSARLTADFPGGNVRPITVLLRSDVPGVGTTLRQEITAIPGVTDTRITDAKPGALLMYVNYSGDSNSAATLRIVKEIRALQPAPGANVMVGGTSAGVVDQLHSLKHRLPLMIGLVAGITFIVLAVGFGSLVVPIKAIAMNLVSIGAAFGVVTWIFQDGHFANWLHFTPTGYVEASQPILMVAVLFGLSLDYEVFLLSRIRERWDELGDNRAAVISGVQRTGRMITTAAVLLCIVLIGFAASGITFIKMVGVGMVVALLVDATLVRLLLVPATMRLLGRYNWWAPAFVQRLYGRYGLREEAPPPEVDEPERQRELASV